MSDTTMADVADKSIDKLAAAIQAAADKAGPMAAQGWEAAVRAEQVSAVVSLISLAVVVAGATMGLLHALRLPKFSEPEPVSRKHWQTIEEQIVHHAHERCLHRRDMFNDSRNWLIGFSLAMFAFASICALSLLPQLVQTIMVPEYAAAKSILEVLK